MKTITAGDVQPSLTTSGWVTTSTPVVVAGGGGAGEVVAEDVVAAVLVAAVVTLPDVVVGGGVELGGGVGAGATTSVTVNFTNHESHSTAPVEVMSRNIASPATNDRGPPSE